MLKEADTINHPYWPRNLSIPNYVANDRSMSEILIFLFSVSGILLLATWSLTGRKVSGRSLSGGRRLALCWFTVCGFIHGVIEGWFSLYYTIIPEDQSFLSQLCEWGSKSIWLRLSLGCFEIIVWKYSVNVPWIPKMLVFLYRERIFQRRQQICNVSYTHACMCLCIKKKSLCIVSNLLLWNLFSRADNFTVSMETVTACLWGPFSIWIVVAFLYNHSYRFVMQLIVSLGKICVFLCILQYMQL